MESDAHHMRAVPLGREQVEDVRHCHRTPIVDVFLQRALITGSQSSLLRGEGFAVLSHFVGASGRLADYGIL